MNTLFDKIWDKHVVQQVEDGPTQLYIDRLYLHEVTSPQAFDTLRDKGLKVFRPENEIAMPDHNTPSDQQEVITDPVGRRQVDTLARNCAEFGIKHFAMGSTDNGIIHVVGPEKALSLPGYTIACGDSHTSTHGAVGAIAMGITSYAFILIAGAVCNGAKGVLGVLKDFSLPISMSFRLFGALLSGLLVTELVYYYVSLSFVLPVFVGVMFTLLHAAIQTYVLTTLVSIFYGEAVEPNPKKIKEKKA